MKMNPELKQKWLEALGSGEYTQGRKVLRSSGNKFCCLGVLCEIGGVPGQLNDDGYYEYRLDHVESYQIAAFFPPDEFLRANGLDPDQCRRLAELNDDGESFEYIADVIEKEM